MSIPKPGRRGPQEDKDRRTTRRNLLRILGATAAAWGLDARPQARAGAMGRLDSVSCSVSRRQP
ncbi:hypothetical protein GCM10028796_56100 [Ramlibacter monticola]